MWSNIVVIIIVFAKCFIIGAQVNITIYRKLPPLYDFDNYDHCFTEPQSKYCIVFAEIESNNYSDIWLEIDNLSKDLFHHFRHENLFFGVCIKYCMELVNIMNGKELEQYSRNKTFDNEITMYYQNIHKSEVDNRLRYQNVLDTCLNYRFHRKYNLTLRTSVEYCEKSQEINKLDSLDIAFYTILAFIILLNIASSIYDCRLKLQSNINNHNNNEFYKCKLKDKASMLLTSFSICRNYYRITNISLNSNPFESDLKITYTFRIITLFIVILGHYTMLMMSTQIQNPEFFENYYYDSIAILFQNGSAVIQIFFVLAAFLLKLKFFQYRMITSETSCRTSALIYASCFLNRYLRLFPSLLLVILFNATQLIRLENGPFWRHNTAAEYVFCRRYWWKNVFMINNFMLKDSCAQHTWFIAADMQLYVLFLFLAILTAKFRIWKKPLYITVGLLACFTPGLLTYSYKLDAVTYLKPESYRYLYFKDVDTFYIVYPPFYCNMGGYLVGFICAEIYMKNIRPNHSKLKNKYLKYRGVMIFEIALFVFILITPIILLLSGNLVINREIEKTSIWLSLYAGLYRNIWSIYGGFILLCMISKVGWIAYKIASLPRFYILGKISFQSYLWHVTILKMLEGFHRQPVYINEFYMICQIILAFVLTNLLSFCITLTVEYPIDEIVKCVFKSKIYKDQKDDNPKEMRPYLVRNNLQK